MIFYLCYLLFCTWYRRNKEASVNRYFADFCNRYWYYLKRCYTAIRGISA